MGHRRFLPEDHVWRNQKSQFNGKKETGEVPKRPAGDEVFIELQGLPPVTFGKRVKKQKIAGFGTSHNWNKHSIFFQLPYWRTLELRHNLDVMHIEKNVYDNGLGTIFNIDGKTKDSLNARLDLQAMDIRCELHPVDNNGKIVLPTACYALTNEEKKMICLWLVNIKVPDGYSSNLTRCVNVGEHKISDMKTHDCHVFLERLLPLIVRDFLPRHVVDALTELSNFFTELCAKVLNKDDLDRLQDQIALTLCKLE
ncbi:hypothetical protein Dsin_013211 [Dipteronia sinensis]|uniref:Uncharacterized protein n=1 Tax=Dipteronia sinensis TaxID=43782 RepID=A0AAE0AJQ3_9ROSI|nr:hypothetical protein Dsin_013211 [Dipteronia sinensis]